MATISVALCTYQGERYLSAQLRSLREQTLRPCEIVVRDDGSTDATQSIISDFARDAPFPVVILPSDERLGYRKNFLLTARHCSGDYIAFCDQDDVWKPWKLRKIADSIAEHAPDLISHGFDLIDEGGDYLSSEVWQNFNDWCGPWSFPLGFTITFSRRILHLTHLALNISDPQFPEKHMAHDEWIWLLAWSLGRTYYIQESLVEYRQHRGNAFGIGGVRSQTFMRHILERLLRFPDCKLLAAISSQIELNFSLADEALSVSRKELEAASLRFSEISRAYETRARVYGGSSFRKRAAAWLSAGEKGIYNRSGRLWFANQAPARDAFLGVLFGGRLNDGVEGRGDNSLRIGKDFVKFSSL